MQVLQTYSWEAGTSEILLLLRNCKLPGSWPPATVLPTAWNHVLGCESDALEREKRKSTISYLPVKGVPRQKGAIVTNLSQTCHIYQSVSLKLSMLTSLFLWNWAYLPIYETNYIHLFSLWNWPCSFSFSKVAHIHQSLFKTSYIHQSCSLKLAIFTKHFLTLTLNRPSDKISDFLNTRLKIKIQPKHKPTLILNHLPNSEKTLSSLTNEVHQYELFLAFFFFFFCPTL